MLVAACAGTSDDPSPPIATAGTAVDAAPIDAAEDGDVPGIVAVHPVLASTVGFCENFGVGLRVDGRRCLTVDAPLDLDGAGATEPNGTAGIAWVRDARAESRGDLGWVVWVDVDPEAFSRVRDAFEAVVADGTTRFAVIVDGRGLLSFEYRALAQQAAFGPLLSEREATLLAGALRGDPWPDLDRRGAQVGDNWLAALGVHVCGEWLPNAPQTDLEAGVHSHGDGLVYVHPTGDDDTGDDATLGRFLALGGWTATGERLELWDDVSVSEGARCPDGREATVRWSVDGEERTGDPNDHRVGHRQVIVLSFDPLGESPLDRAEEPPQLANLPSATLGPDFANASG